MSAGDLKQSTTLTAAILASGQIGATTATTLYTVPAASQVKVATASLCNISGSTVTVTVSVVPSGGSVDGTHVVLSAYSLLPNDTITQDDVLAALKGVMLGVGTFVSVTASVSGAVDYLLTGAVSA